MNISRRFFLCVFLLVTPAWATEDFQGRLLTHGQLVGKSGFGIGVWQNVPDFTREGPLRVLLVAGPAYKTKSFWIEVMGGGFAEAGEPFDPVINIRTVSEFGRFRLFNEGLYTKKAGSFLLDPNLILQVRGPLWVGIEADLLFKKGRDNLGIGPRIALKFSPHVTLALGYQVRTMDSNVLRSYLTLTF